MPYRRSAGRSRSAPRARVAARDAEGTALLVLILVIGSMPFAAVTLGRRPAPGILGGATVMVIFALLQLAAWAFARRHRRAFDPWPCGTSRRSGWWRRPG